MGACCGCSVVKGKIKPRGYFDPNVAFGSDLVSPQRAMDIHTEGTVTESRATGPLPNEIKEVESKIPIENTSNIVEVSSEDSNTMTSAEPKPEGRDHETKSQSKPSTLTRALQLESTGPLSEQDKLHLEDSATRKQMTERSMDREVFSDSEVPGVKSSHNHLLLNRPRRNSEPFLNQPLLHVEGKHVRRLTDNVKKLFADIKKSKDTGGKLPKKDFVTYFRAQGMKSRACRQLYAKFKPKEATWLSFREFNEHILVLTLKVGEKPKETPVARKRLKRGNTIKRWSPKPR